MSSTAHLNLARKWRSQQFDQIIGQDLCVRMLKNSLYLHHFFPVYLFSGQRGCGKTTTARVFASAINCVKFEAFAKEPKKHIIPCLVCDSCKAMLAGKHPDFIEMDAASHTGVDNVRQIIDASSLMPLMGRKKIYLIDEAHMLSKAAFNAFLKILEEPPTSVLFVLATTDPDKIIDTVRSRCFQLFFKPIDAAVLRNHLIHVCDKEGIGYEIAGLDLIIQETEGSARDALNMLESVRFSAGSISKKAVLCVLGHVEDERIIALLQAIISDDAVALLHGLQQIDTSQNTAVYVWRSFLQLLRACIWIKHGVAPDVFIQHIDTIKKMLKRVDWKRIHTYLNFCYKNEQVFLKTVHQYAFLEMILLQLCGYQTKLNNSESDSGCSSSPMPALQSEPNASQEGYEDEDDEEENIDEQTADFAQKWKLCLRDIQLLDDPLVSSIFKQSVFRQFDEKESVLEVEFSKKFVFFQDWLDSTQNLWMDALKKRFGSHLIFKPHFTGKDVEPVKAAPKVLTHVPERKPIQNKSSYAHKGNYQKKRSYGYSKQKKSHGPLINVSEKELWPKTHMLLQYFPGTVHEVIKGNVNE